MRVHWLMKTVVLVASFGSGAIASSNGAGRNLSSDRVGKHLSRACAQAEPRDSAFFLDMALKLAQDSALGSDREFANVQMSNDVSYFGSSAQCDTVAQRYRSYHVARTGDANWPLVDVLMIRIGANRIIADPRVSTEDGGLEFVTLDSSLNVLKVWGVLR
jgi:hypothetical protein